MDFTGSCFLETTQGIAEISLVTDFKESLVMICVDIPWKNGKEIGEVKGVRKEK